MEAAEFAESSIWGELQGSIDILVDLDVTSDQGKQIDRVRLRASRILAAKNADPADFTSEMLAKVAWAGVSGYLTQAIADLESPSALSYLTNAANDADVQWGVAVTYWPYFSPYPDENGSVAYIEALERLASRLREQLDEARSALDEDFAAAERRFAELDQSTAALTTQIAADEVRLDTALTEQSTRFTEEQAARSEAFSDAQAERQTAFDAQEARHNEAAEALLNAMRATRTEVESLGSETAQALFARNHGKYAWREWLAGIIAYVIALGFVVAAIVVLGHAVVDAADRADIPWTFVVLRFGFAVTMGGGAAVLFRIGSTFQRRSAESKRTELELRALPPLLDAMDDDTARTVRAEYIARSFGQRENGSNEPNSVAMPTSDVANLVEQVVRIVQAVKSP